MAQMTALRRRMIDDMTLRNLSPATQQSYVYAVAKFSRFFGRSPDQLGVEEVRTYQIHLVGHGLSWPHQRGGKRSTAGRSSALCSSGMTSRGTDASRESVDATRTRDPAPEARRGERPADRPVAEPGAQHRRRDPGAGRGGGPALAAADDTTTLSDCKRRCQATAGSCLVAG